jgi:2-dehydropantoate 2-reductase
MRIVIVGAGALGSLFGGLLARAGQDVRLYNPSNVEHIRAIQASGLSIETPEGERLRIQIPAAERIGEIPTPVDLVGVFVKAHRTEEALQQARPLISRETWLLSLQNGIGVEEILKGYAPRGRVLRGVTTQGAALIEPGVVSWAGRGPTLLGPLTPTDSTARREIDMIIRALCAAGLEAQDEPDIEKALWEKLLVNAAINPLTALFDVPNGQLVADHTLREILHDVVRETLPVAAEHGVQLSLEEAIERVEGVCRATARNISSMLQDVRRGRPTEIDFINGAVVREGRRLGIPTPLSRLLWELVRRRTRSSRA